MKRRICVWAFLALACGKKQAASIGTDAAQDVDPAADVGAAGSDEAAVATGQDGSAAATDGPQSDDSAGTMAKPELEISAPSPLWSKSGQGMQLESTGSDEGVVAFAVSLQAELAPLTRAEMLN